MFVRNVCQRCFSTSLDRSLSQSHATHSSKSAVVSFRKFIPQHVKFVNRIPLPVSPMIYYDSTDYDYDYELGRHFLQMMEFYLESGRLQLAGDLMRNVVCSNLLQNTSSVRTLKLSFIGALHQDFRKLPSPEDYLDITLKFYGDTNYNRFVRSTLRSLLERDHLARYLATTAGTLPKEARIALHSTLVRVVLDSGQLDYLCHVNYKFVTRDTAKALLMQLCTVGMSSEALKLVKEAGERYPVLVKQCYSRLSAQTGLEKDRLRLERWMRDHGFESLVEGKGVQENEEEEDGGDWNELDNI